MTRMDKVAFDVWALTLWVGLPHAAAVLAEHDGAAGHQLQSGGEGAVLRLPDSVAQTLLGVAAQHGHGLLRDDGSCVHLFLTRQQLFNFFRYKNNFSDITFPTYCHKVNRAARHPHPGLQRLLLGIHALEWRQQGWMDVQQFPCNTNKRCLTWLGQLNVRKAPWSRWHLHTVPFLDKVSREDPHESSQTHQLHPELLQHAVNGAVKLCPAPVHFVIHHLFKVRHENLTI